MPAKRLKKAAAAHLALVGAAELSQAAVWIRKTENSKGSIGMGLMFLELANGNQGLWYAIYRDRVEDCLAVHTRESRVGDKRCAFLAFVNNEVM